MIAEYRFHYDEAFLIEGFRRYRSRHQQRLWMAPLKIFGFAGLALLLGIAVYARLFVPAAAFAFFLLLLAAGPRFDYLLLRRRLRKSPFFNSEVVVELSADGYLGRDENSRTELSWRLFTKGYRFADGFLLLNGPQHYHWWPDAALSEGDVNVLDTFLRSTITDCHAAEQRTAGDARNART